MKKFLLVCAVALFAFNPSASAQCVPNTTITQPGITPDSATGLASGISGQLYTQVMQIRVPADTVVELIPGVPVTVPITSITLTSFTGLPPGITYTCTPSNCVFPGGSNGCVLISGTTNVAGNYPLTAIISTVASVFGNPVTQVDTLSYYSIDISNATTGIDESTGLNFSMDQNSPNPCNENTGIRYSLPSSGEVDFRIFNLIGKEVYRSLLNAEQGINELRLDSRDFAPGVYMYTMTFNGETLSKRMVISRK
ncbi:MAG: T9SS type A sorting domain-containing protein [Bacteroidia bacterium]|nr:T9SS type A sorting domain-containing protein [Bacteroidia bacterium]